MAAPLCWVYALEVYKCDFKIQPPDHDKIKLYNFVRKGLDYLSRPHLQTHGLSKFTQVFLMLFLLSTYLCIPRIIQFLCSAGNACIWQTQTWLELPGQCWDGCIRSSFAWRLKSFLKMNSWESPYVNSDKSEHFWQHGGAMLWKTVNCKILWRLSQERGPVDKGSRQVSMTHKMTLSW